MLGRYLAASGLMPGTHDTMIPMWTSTTDHMKDSETIHEKSPYSFLWSPDVLLLSPANAADSRYAIRITSTTATKPPKLKVIINISFSFLGRRMPVRIGIGRNSRAKSVIMFTGAEDRYNATMSMHVALSGRGSRNAAPNGLH